MYWFCRNDEFVM